ncbi:MAG TPA: AraC family transcriptional regulator [Longimicrobiaceae bacterium]|nr:AraC family transcriptional regulator [Longimicrobiaceae bacterium]
MHTPISHRAVVREPWLAPRSGCRFSESRYAPGTAMPAHAHEHPYFGLVLEGGFHERVDQRERSCGARRLFLHPAGATHAVRFGPAQTRIFRVEITPALLDSLPRRAARFERPDDTGAPAEAQLMLRMRREVLEPDELTPLAVEGLLLELLAAWGRGGHPAERRTPAWLARAVEYLHAHSAEPVTMTVLAAVAGVPPGRLGPEFRRHYHCTPGEYLRRLRVEAACRLLAETDRPLSEVALSAGFYDQSHLNRHFRRLLGTTPAAWRASASAAA